MLRHILDLMKRSEFLISLSHDHHQSLFLAQRMRRADADSAAEIGEAYLRYWREDGARHFREEEEVLLPVYAEYADPTDALVAEVLTEHVQIRSQVGVLERQLSAAPDGSTALATLHGLGELLAVHVRREERQLFPQIEAALPAAAATELAAILSP